MGANSPPLGLARNWLGEVDRRRLNALASCMRVDAQYLERILTGPLSLIAPTPNQVDGGGQQPACGQDHQGWQDSDVQHCFT
jgi:hypothetical protein